MLFALSLFAAAGLSFLVQPLIARQLLPHAGGAPAVWTTCLVFFQLMLLAGYVYSHVLSRQPHGVGLVVHLLLLGGAAAMLLQPDALAPDPHLAEWIDRAPVAGLVAGLLLAVGLPYFALSATAPLLQAWFARSGRGPYWLYAASNAGSLLGLLSYPFLVEPYLPLDQQRWQWRMAFAAVAAGIALCGMAAWQWRPAASLAPANREPLSAARRLRWIGLAALTASLLASVTAHLSTDITPMPLLWVVPLAIYLTTYIIAFARWPDRARQVCGRLTPMTICFTAVALLQQATEPMLLVAAVHLVGFAAVCMLCHGELAADKPCPSQLTEFYLCLAIGGVIGGSFNAVLAPVLFAHVGPVEYPLALVLAALVRPNGRLLPLGVSDIFAPIVVLAATVLLGLGAASLFPQAPSDDAGGELLQRVLGGGLKYGLPMAAAFALAWRPLRFALSLAAVLATGMVLQTQTSHVLEIQRNFFGTLTVSRSDDGEFTVLTHGNTRHGQQRVGNGVRPEPAMYYHRGGPLGVAFAMPARRVGVVGLGCGAMAAYAEPGQHWTFFEIDPGVVRIASNENYFTFLSTCRADLKIVLGDARRRLAEAPDGSFDLIAIDAFSSDAVPSHLLTREAFDLYFRKLAPRGRLLLHLSNRYLDLPALAARVVRSIDPGRAVMLYNDSFVSDADRLSGKKPSIWVLVGEREEDLGRVRPHFVPLPARPGPVWTDDYTPLWSVWKRDEE